MRKHQDIHSKVINNLYQYEDYRALLEDYFNEQKEIQKKFSHRYFAQKAGIASSGYCVKVIKGVINVSRDYVEKLCRGMELNREEKQYFASLVQYSHAEDVASKMNLKKKLDSYRERKEAEILTSKDVDFYKSWYVPVIRELVHYSEWNGDYKKLANLVYPSITENEAIAAVQLLLDMGMIIKNEDGTYEKKTNIVKSGTVPGFARKKARRDIIQRALEAIELLPVNQRHVSYSTLAMSEKSYQRLETYLDQVRESIFDLIAEDEDAEKIYHVMLALFPSSKNFGDIE